MNGSSGRQVCVNTMPPPTNQPGLPLFMRDLTSPFTVHRRTGCGFTILLGAILFAAVSTPAAGAENWPRFRGPNGSGVSRTGSFPTVFGPEANVVWKTPLPAGHSSPCIWGDRIFLTAFEDGELWTLALDRTHGRVLWRAAVSPTSLEQGGSRHGRPATSTPGTDGARVYVYFGSFGMVCYDFAGNELWRRPLPVPVTQHGASTSPVVAGDRVLLACDQDVGSYLLAVDAATGRDVWRVERPGYRRGFATPILWPENNPTHLILPGTLRLNAYALSDGREEWVARGLPNEMVSSPVLGDGLIYAAGWTPGSGVRVMPGFDELLQRGDQDRDGMLTREEAPAGPARNHFVYIDANKDGRIDREEWTTLAAIFESSRNALLAVRPGGQGDITDSHVAWSFERGLPYCPSPLYYDGRLYLVKNGGLASAFDARSGQVLFQEERIEALGDYYASPIAAGGKVLMISQPGTAVVLRAGDQLEVLARNQLGETVMATPAVIGDTLYLRTEGHLYAFAETGKPAGIAARYPGDRGIASDPRVVFAEDFEQATLAELHARWETITQGERMTFTPDTPAASGGRQSLQMTHLGGEGTGGHLYRRLPPGHEQLYARFYVKFDPDCVPIHHFGTTLGGHNPPTPWPSVKAGTRPAGDQTFWVGIEPFGDRWVWDYYAYWGEMRGSPPRGQTWGNSFVRDDSLLVRRGEWICVEMVIKLNQVGDRDGELALWIDGRPVSHLGKGFPKGRWTFDKFFPGEGGPGVRWDDALNRRVNFEVPAGGAPFEGFQWRTVEELKINYVWLYVYITQSPPGHASKVWFDDVVVATEYIGPLAR
jgi:outer membrane protein assembly factor BamB